jgi:hypothetical protein
MGWQNGSESGGGAAAAARRIEKYGFRPSINKNLSDSVRLIQEKDVSLHSQKSFGVLTSPALGPRPLKQETEVERWMVAQGSALSWQC